MLNFVFPNEKCNIRLVFDSKNFVTHAGVAAGIRRLQSVVALYNKLWHVWTSGYGLKDE